MDERVLQPDIPRVPPEIHPLAVLIIMPPQRVVPSINLLVACEAYCLLPSIRDVPSALPVPTKVFPAGVAAPLSPNALEERVGLVTSRSMWR